MMFMTLRKSGRVTAYYALVTLPEFLNVMDDAAGVGDGHGEQAEDPNPHPLSCFWFLVNVV